MRPKRAYGVLVVDDEPTLCRLCRRLLEKAGYRVYTAGSGIEGLKVLEERSADIQVVYSDVSMPEMGGDELAGLVNERYPDIEVILSSGYPEEEYAESLVGKRYRFIQKPFRNEKLLSLIARSLGRDQSVTELAEECSDGTE